jgi:hypothetical protein
VKFWENDELRQDYNTEDMEHPVRAIVAWASTIAPLEVGDVFAFRIPPLARAACCTISPAVLALRWVFLEQSWTTYWDAQAQLAA